MDGWMDGWMDGFMDGWMDGWMREWMGVPLIDHSLPCLIATMI